MSQQRGKSVIGCKGISIVLPVDHQSERRI